MRAKEREKRGGRIWQNFCKILGIISNTIDFSNPWISVKLNYSGKIIPKMYFFPGKFIEIISDLLLVNNFFFAATL